MSVQFVEEPATRAAVKPRKERTPKRVNMPRWGLVSTIAGVLVLGMMLGGNGAQTQIAELKTQVAVLEAVTQ